jgi:hypothetical protein
MPTILRESGWRLYFYSNEGYEPVHVHARKGEMECKFKVIKEDFDIQEVWSSGLTPNGRREIRKIIFKYFDFILFMWDGYFYYF